MKISGSSGNNINFIEQKTNNIKSNNTQEDRRTISMPSDSFSTTSVKQLSISSHNSSLGMLEVAYSSLQQLKTANKELQNISEKFTFFKSEEAELNNKFDETIEKMLDIVDSTVYENNQLFYTNMSFSIDQSMPSFMMSEIINIEDLSIEDVDGLNIFDKKLSSLEEQLEQAKSYLQNVSFNSLASLSYKESFSYEQITESMNSNETKKYSLNDIQSAHDVSSLKDRVSALLDENEI